MSTTYPTPTFNWATLGGNATAGLQAVPLQQLHIVSVLDYGAKGDGATNDTTAIQNTLNTYAGKAVVLIPDTGSPYVVNPLVLPTGTDLIVHGTLHGISAANGVLTIPSGASNVTIRGHGTLDGTNTMGAYILVTSATKVVISGVTMQNANNWNLNVTGSTGVIVDGVRMLGGHAANEFAAGCTECWLTNSYISGNTDNGFAFYGGITNSGAIGNTITGNNGGMGVVSDPAQPAICTGIVMSNNIIYSNAFQGLYVSTSGVGNWHSSITISDNELYNNCTSPNPGGGAAPNCDIFLAACYYSVVSGNKMHRCGNGGHGIVIGGFGYAGCVGVQITGNSISEEGQGATTASGIVIGSANNLAIIGNHIYDDQTTKTMQYAVSGTMGVASSIVGNHFGGLISSAPLSITTVADSVVANSRTSAALFSIRAGTLSLVQPMQWTNVATPEAGRWFVGNDGSTESGSNTGSNFEINAVSDAGGQTQIVLITRATGAVKLFAGLGLWNTAAPASKPAVTGAKGGNAALGSLLSALASYGLVTDSTTS